MKVTRLEIENFCKIVALDVQLKEGITEISGPNGAGKSSTLNGLWVLLKGKKVAPAEPIRKGAERCRLRGQIGEYLVTRTFRRHKGDEVTTDLRIERGDESMAPTEAFLRALIGEHMLDPGDFIRLRPEEKFDVFRSFVPGIDFKKFANQNRQDYERRTEVNRIARDARSAAALLEVPEDTPEALIDEAALTEELAQAGEVNADIERRRANREKAVEVIRHCRAVTDTAEREIAAAAERSRARTAQEVARIEEQIAALQRQIETIQSACEAEIATESQRLRDESARAATEADELQGRLEAAEPLPEAVDVAVLRKRIEYARLVNEQVRKRQMRARHVATAEQYEAEATELTRKMDAREKAKQEAIAAVKLPVSGISFGDGEIFLDGIPFDQASTAQKFRVGVAIAVAKNPTLRLVWVRDASLLDDRSYGLVAELAREFDCQVLLETVRPIGSDAVVLEDGQLKVATEVQQDTAA